MACNSVAPLKAPGNFSLLRLRCSIDLASIFYYQLIDDSETTPAKAYGNEEETFSVNVKQKADKNFVYMASTIYPLERYQSFRVLHAVTHLNYPMRAFRQTKNNQDFRINVFSFESEG